jgi:hypothetical protein
MKPDRTIIRLSFPHPVYGTFTPIRVEYEYPLGPKDNDQDALDDGKARAEAWFSSRYPPLDLGHSGSDSPLKYHTKEEVDAATSIVVDRSTLSEDRRIAALIADIYSCTELKVLESYRIMAKAKPELQAAYDIMFEKLSKY